MNRRNFIRNSSLLSSAMLLPSISRGADNWSGGQIQHLLPLTNHDSILLKVSFVEPQSNPSLHIRSLTFPGRRRDTLGRFWSFRAGGLESSQTYELSLHTQDGSRFADSWSLTTTPAPDADSESMRLLIFSCAGGPDNAQTQSGAWRYLPVTMRQRLLDRALSFAPDLAIGVGDQTYWDQNVARRWLGDVQRQRNRERIYGKYGKFDEDLPVFGSSNEATLTNCQDEQIASLYSTNFRSVPLILTQDDHDYFENDEGTDDIVTFPPRNFTERLARASQSLYFPEYLPDENRPVHLAGSAANGSSETYGSYRWGSLLELLMYDCRRFITLAGPTAVFVEETAERWMATRTADETSTRHLIHIPLIISGDLHAIGSAMITRSAELNFDKPVHTILAGPIGTGTGWPSAVRGSGATVPISMELEERVHPIEDNGFSILDIDSDSIQVKQFAWLPTQGLDRIDTLEPFSTFRLTR